MVDAANIRLVGQTDLGGHGDCMHVNVKDGIAYVGHMGGDRVGTSIVDVSDPRKPRVITQIETPPGTHSHKVQVVGDVLLVNHERNPHEPDAKEWSTGVAVYDIADPARPKQVSFIPSPGNGVHRMMYWEAPYAWISGTDTGYKERILTIVDLSDPGEPKEVGRFWLPGMHSAAGETSTWSPDRKWSLHHALVRGDRAYCGWWDGGLVILDVSDLTRPTLVSQLEFGADVSAATHTAFPLPGRDVVVVTDECLSDQPDSMRKQIRVVDVSDEANPRVVSTLPIPAGDYINRPGRFGPHNLHEMRPGTYQSDHIVHVAYFNAGLRVFDLSDATQPREIAHFTPPPHGSATSLQFNDLTVAADGLIYVTDRVAGGLYILEPEIDFG
jgi:hypothetical protein